jgi:hypothetical protein
MAQRGFSHDDVLFIYQHAKREHFNGAIQYFMMRKRIPSHLLADDSIGRLIGVRVVVCPCNQCVITVFREDRKREYRDYAPDRGRDDHCQCCGRKIA